MVNVSHKKTSFKKIILPLIGVALFVFVLLLLLEKSRTTDLVKDPFKKPTGPTVEQKEQEAKTSRQSKGDFLDSQYKNVSTPSTSMSSDSQPTSQPGAKVMIDSRQETAIVVVTAKITNIATGTCVLQINNAGKVHLQEAEVIYQPEYSSCAGFAIPVSNLGPGNWQITLDVKNGATNFATTSASLEVK